MIKWFSSLRRERLLFLSSNMAFVKSATNLQQAVLSCPVLMTGLTRNNFVPRSVVDEAEGEICSIPICKCKHLSGF